MVLMCGHRFLKERTKAQTQHRDRMLAKLKLVAMTKGVAKG
jgi:hypothetical protein